MTIFFHLTPGAAVIVKNAPSAYQDDEPCRNPDWAVSSVEAYGMNVAALMKTAGMPYNHGKRAIGFVGLILFIDPAR